ncbi:MAG: hypothetical protein AVDCRST_MAG79-1424 [uncultured Thermoleophilia bacterium]|uniref:Uncharacterized protein n=1 Tax=uncultured Thermoleophilia bacterium TaxID=1497501 RepID=A0A6J4TZH1_9ACTN|nr:MAG: hypothetical protein AVDCRST_MAG79-1424 [uncultured Thermoleophilia bacterium]
MLRRPRPSPSRAREPRPGWRRSDRDREAHVAERKTSEPPAARPVAGPRAGVGLRPRAATSGDARPVPTRWRPYPRLGRGPAGSVHRPPPAHET